jgi:hypothetical protein
MDPDAALEAIRERLRELTDELDGIDPTDVTDELQAAIRLADELVELTKGLDQWLSTSGFLPAAWRRHAQFHRLGELIEQFHATDVVVNRAPFDLPDGYVLLQLADADGRHMTFGIDQEGRASS